MKGITLAQLQATGLPLEIHGSSGSSIKPPRRRPGEMNRLEGKYADFLSLQQMTGVIKKWWFEAIALRIGQRCFWHPDFLIEFADGHFELHDTKGHVKDDALVKAKAVADKFPFLVFHVTLVKGTWQHKRIG